MLRFVVAFQAEARPLVERFGMEPAGDGPFAIYRGDDAWLIVSGLGKAAAAPAPAAAGRRRPPPRRTSISSPAARWAGPGSTSVSAGTAPAPWAKASSPTRS